MSHKKQKTTELEQSVMAQISSGEVKMKSRWHFVALNVILIVSATLFTILASILISLTIHDIRVGQQLGLSEFGDAGNEAFRSSLPLLMVFFAVLSIGAVVLLAKHFEFSYRHKFNALAAVVLLTIAGLTGLVSASGLNDDLADTPPFRPLSTLKKLADEQRVIGVIAEAGEMSYLVNMPDDTAVTIVISEKTKYLRAPMVGDAVVVFGSYANSGDKKVFNAYGLRVGDPRVRHPLQDHPRVKAEKTKRMIEEIIDIDEINRRLAE